MDRELVSASQRGDRAAFRALVERHYPLACAVARRYGAADDCRDVAQEAFVAAWERLGDLRSPDKFRAWLCGIVRFTVSAKRRHRCRHAPEARESRVGIDELRELPTLSPSVFDQLAQRERARQLIAELERLPAKYREPLLLHYVESKSIAEVASALSLSDVAVRQRLSRGRKQLTRRLRAMRAGFAAGVAGLLGAARPASAAAAAWAWSISSAAKPLAAVAVALVAVAVSSTGGPELRAIPVAVSPKPMVASASAPAAPVADALAPLANDERAMRTPRRQPALRGHVTSGPATVSRRPLEAPARKVAAVAAVAAPVAATDSAPAVVRPAITFADVPLPESTPPPQGIGVEAPALRWDDDFE